MSAPRCEVSLEVRVEVLRLRRRGLGMKIIGQTLGISRDRVRAVLRDAGLIPGRHVPADPTKLKRLNVDLGAVQRLERSEHARRVSRILAEHGPEGLKMLRRP